MSSPGHGWVRRYYAVLKLRAWLANSLGVVPQRRADVYLEVSRAATLLDAGYWLQLFFAAGIATLGLVLNSPAVIIGAMLISPLMGPILSGGLAVAAGDLVLGIRSVTNLLLSCAVSAGFATLLVWLLPFKEITAEIAGRIQPNTLDLIIALFSGAIGSISICAQARGVVTSIPGVAIAVALMPPLCVVGFGFGVAASIGDAQGLRIARGGGLLFFTNLVAITFTAMVTFIILQINTQELRMKIKPELERDIESVRVRAFLRKTPIIGQLRWLQSLPARLVFTVAILALLAIPLAKSFTQFKEEITRKHQEARLLNLATRLCEERLPGKEAGPRCYVGHLDLLGQGDHIEISLRVFTRKPYSEAERTRYLQQASAILGQPPEAVSLQLVEVPTASGDLVAAQAQAQKRPEPALTVAQLEGSLVRAVNGSLTGMTLPAPATLLDYKVAASEDQPLRVTVSYLSDHAMSGDAQDLLTADIRQRLNDQKATAEFDNVPWNPASISFRVNEVSLSRRNKDLFDKAGQPLQDHTLLKLSIHAELGKGENLKRMEERNRLIVDYLRARWEVAPDRIQFSESQGTKRLTTMTLHLNKPSKTQ